MSWLIYSLVLAVVLSPVLGQETLTNITIGLSLPASQPNFVHLVIDAKQGFDFAAKWIKEHPINISDGKGGSLKLGFDFDILDDGFNPQKIINNYDQFIKNKKTSILVGPLFTLSTIMSQHAERHNWASFHWMSYEFGVARRGLSIVSPPDTYFFSTVSSLRLAGAKTVSLIWTADSERNCNSPEFDEYLKDNALEVLGKYPLISFSGSGLNSNTDPSLYPEELVKNYTSTADKVMVTDPDVWMFCSTVAQAGNILMSHFRDHDYTPRAFLGEIPISGSSLLDPELTAFRGGVSSFEATAEYPKTTYGTMTEFFNDIKKEYNTTASEFHLNAYILSLMLKNAIESVAKEHVLYVDENGRLSIDVSGRAGNCTCATIEDEGILLFQNELFQAMFSMKIDTISGRYSWGTDHRQQRESVFFQYVNGNREVVAPERIKTRSLVYPMPTWSEREFKQEYGHYTEITATAVVILLSLISIGLLVYISIVKFTMWIPISARKIVLAASPVFLALILIGSILLYVSVLFGMPNVVSKITCISRMWFQTLGFVLLFGPLFAKTLRIERLFRTKSTKIFSISNKTVIIWVGALLGVYISLLIIMTVLNGYDIEMVIVDDLRPIHNYNKCRLELTFRIFFYIIYSLNSLLIVVGAVLAYRVRHIPIKKYNESKVIFFAIYNIFFFAALALGLSFAKLDRFTRFLIVSCLILGGTALTILSLFGQMCMISTSLKQQRKRNAQEFDTKIDSAYTTSTVISGAD